MFTQAVTIDCAASCTPTYIDKTQSS